MLINEVSKQTHLTKKAIEYYTGLGFVSPNILDNSYRNYSEVDVEVLKKIYVLKKLNLSIKEIKTVLDDSSSMVLHDIVVQKELLTAYDDKKNKILKKLSTGSTYLEVSSELEILDNSTNIIDRLREIFPSYFGRYLCMHFSNFLSEPIVSDEQKQAFDEIINFLDSTPTISFPEDVKEYIDKATDEINEVDMAEVYEKVKSAYDDTENYIKDNKEFIKEYISFKESDEFKRTPASKMMEIMKDFNAANGYNDVFIPAMVKLSKSYADYYAKVQKANEIFLKQFPN